MLEKILITSLIVICIWATLLPDMIFGFVRDWLDKKNVSEFWQKPIATCPICMNFYYGSIFYWLIYRGSFLEWGIVIFASMGLTTILVNLFRNE